MLTVLDSDGPLSDQEMLEVQQYAKEPHQPLAKVFYPFHRRVTAELFGDIPILARAPAARVWGTIRKISRPRVHGHVGRVRFLHWVFL
jgi:hypothetical protein